MKGGVWSEVFIKKGDHYFQYNHRVDLREEHIREVIFIPNEEVLQIYFANVLKANVDDVLLIASTLLETIVPPDDQTTKTALRAITRSTQVISAEAITDLVVGMLMTGTGITNPCYVTSLGLDDKEINFSPPQSIAERVVMSFSEPSDNKTFRLLYDGKYEDFVKLHTHLLLLKQKVGTGVIKYFDVDSKKPGRFFSSKDTPTGVFGATRDHIIKISDDVPKPLFEPLFDKSPFDTLYYKDIEYFKQHVGIPSSVPLSASGIPLSASGIPLSASGIPLPASGIPLPASGIAESQHGMKAEPKAEPKAERKLPNVGALKDNMKSWMMVELLTSKGFTKEKIRIIASIDPELLRSETSMEEFLTDFKYTKFHGTPNGSFHTFYQNLESFRRFLDTPEGQSLGHPTEPPPVFTPTDSSMHVRSTTQ
jgi:hypothetical protein